jgi:hypothetical protein
MCIFIWNIKSNIFGNGNKGIPNNIVSSHAFSLVRTSNKVYPHQVYRLTTYAMGYAKGHYMGKAQPYV